MGIKNWFMTTLLSSPNSSLQALCPVEILGCFCSFGGLGVHKLLWFSNPNVTNVIVQWQKYEIKWLPSNISLRNGKRLKSPFIDYNNVWGRIIRNVTCLQEAYNILNHVVCGQSEQTINIAKIHSGGRILWPIKINECPHVKMAYGSNQHHPFTIRGHTCSCGCQRVCLQIIPASDIAANPFPKVKLLLFCSNKCIPSGKSQLPGANWQFWAFRIHTFTILHVTF